MAAAPFTDFQSSFNSQRPRGLSSGCPEERRMTPQAPRVLLVAM
jgi:hypothetical protein